jgi:hypothetical protein
MFNRCITDYLDLLHQLDGLDFVRRAEFNSFYVGDETLKISVQIIHQDPKIIFKKIVEGCGTRAYKNLSFEQFFEACPPDIQEKIIWNLDFFKGKIGG